MTKEEATRLLYKAFRTDENLAHAIIAMIKEREQLHVAIMSSTPKTTGLDDLKCLIEERAGIGECKVLADIFNTLLEEAPTAQEIYAKTE